MALHFWEAVVWTFLAGAMFTLALRSAVTAIRSEPARRPGPVAFTALAATASAVLFIVAVRQLSGPG